MNTVSPARLPSDIAYTAKTRLSAMRASYFSRLLARPASSLKGLAWLKTVYRPYVCPMGWVLSEIPEYARLYDIGCGTGALLYLARRVRHVAVAHGYDVDPGAIAASAVFADTSDCSWYVVQLAMEKTPPDLADYDTVTMVDVLHHIPPNRQQSFLTDMAATMSIGAKLILKDIDASKLVGRWANQLHDLLLAHQWVFPQSRSTTLTMLKNAGFTVIRHEIRWSLWYPHFLILAQKTG